MQDKIALGGYREIEGEASGPTALGLSFSDFIFAPPAAMVLPRLSAGTQLIVSVLLDLSREFVSPRSHCNILIQIRQKQHCRLTNSEENARQNVGRIQCLMRTAPVGFESKLKVLHPLESIQPRNS